LPQIASITSLKLKSEITHKEEKEKEKGGKEKGGRRDISQFFIEAAKKHENEHKRRREKGDRIKRKPPER